MVLFGSSSPKRNNYQKGILIKKEHSSQGILIKRNTHQKGTRIKKEYSSLKRNTHQKELIKKEHASKGTHQKGTLIKRNTH